MYMPHSKFSRANIANVEATNDDLNAQIFLKSEAFL